MFARRYVPRMKAIRITRGARALPIQHLAEGEERPAIGTQVHEHQVLPRLLGLLEEREEADLPARRNIATEDGGTCPDE